MLKELLSRAIRDVQEILCQEHLNSEEGRCLNIFACRLCTVCREQQGLEDHTRIPAFHQHNRAPKEIRARGNFQYLHETTNLPHSTHPEANKQSKQTFDTQPPLPEESTRHAVPQEANTIYRSIREVTPKVTTYGTLLHPPLWNTRNRSLHEIKTSAKAARLWREIILHRHMQNLFSRTYPVVSTLRRAAQAIVAQPRPLSSTLCTTRTANACTRVRPRGTPLHLQRMITLHRTHRRATTHRKTSRRYGILLSHPPRITPCPVSLCIAPRLLPFPR